jgi:hypothetical protein
MTDYGCGLWVIDKAKKTVWLIAASLSENYFTSIIQGEDPLEIISKWKRWRLIILKQYRQCKLLNSVSISTAQ